MRTVLYIILITFTSCRYDYKICDSNSTDEQVKIYNNILNDLVEHHFYNIYLGVDEENIFKQYASDNPDTAKIRRNVIQLQNKLFNDTVRFCNIYIDTIFSANFNKWSYYQSNTGRFQKEIKNIISTFSPNGQLVIDSLNSMQSRLSPNDFQLCTSKVLSVTELNDQKNECKIGIISFSKIFFDKRKNNGLLYYNFRCGGNCGKGELLIIKKIDDRWTIIETIMTWIS